MMRPLWKKTAGGAMAALLVGLVGCQSVGGVDVNQVIKQAFDAPSSQSNLHVSVLVTPRNGLTAEQQAALPKLRQLEVDVPTILREDKRHASYEGELSAPERKAIPFQAYVNGNEIVFQIAGAEQPIVWKAGLTKGLGAGGDAGPLLQPVLDALQKSIAAHLDELAPALVNWVVANAPNPDTIDVTPVDVTVHGEKLALSKLHIAIGAGELGPWSEQLLDQLAQDEAGTKVFLGELYDVVAPDLLAEDSGLSPLVRSLLGSKDRSVELIYSYIKENVLSKQDTFMAVAGEALNEASLDLSLYVDDQGQTHKSELEAALPRLDQDGDAIATLTVKASKELWDIGKPVKAKPLTAGDDAYVIGGGQTLNRTKLLHTFDPQSETYRFLKDDVKLAAKNVRMVMDADAGSDPGDSGRPFIREGVTLVPARYVSENLDADIAWDGAARKVTITDETTGQRIVLTIDSRTALVNGSAVELEQAATITGGSTYVPVRFIAEQLGAKVGWDGASRTVSIVRD